MEVVGDDRERSTLWKEETKSCIVALGKEWTSFVLMKALHASESITTEIAHKRA